MKERSNELAAIRFNPEVDGVGLDILLDKGPVQVWPGVIYTNRRVRIERAIENLLASGVSGEVNFDLPKPLRWDEALNLGKLPGWRKF